MNIRPNDHLVVYYVLTGALDIGKACAQRAKAMGVKVVAGRCRLTCFDPGLTPLGFNA